MSEYKLTPGGSVTRLSDGASIPPDPANIDYAEFLRWQEAGGVPDARPEMGTANHARRAGRAAKHDASAAEEGPRS